MAQPKTVLVTGVSGYWGSHVAARLATLPDMRVIGMDNAPPKEAIQGLDFIQADVRNPLLASLLREEAVDAVCHLAFLESDHRSEAAFDLNVMGTMKVFGACTDAGVRKIIYQERHDRLRRPSHESGLHQRGTRPGRQFTERHRARPVGDRVVLQWFPRPAARHRIDHPSLPKHHRPQGQHAR